MRGGATTTSVSKSPPSARAEQIGGFSSEAILRDLVEVGFLHRAAAASDAGETASRRIAPLIVAGGIVLLAMRLDTEVDLGCVAVIAQEEHFAAIGDEHEGVVG